MFSSFSTLPLCNCTIIDSWYIHVKSSLVLKATRANKELYLSSLIVSPSKECKQDKINLSFIPTPYSTHMAWHLVWEAALFMLFVELV